MDVQCAEQVVAAAFTSGFCGVYQQKILQAGKTNMWVRNAQLCLFTIPIAFGGTFFVEDKYLREDGNMMQRMVKDMMDG